MLGVCGGMGQLPAVHSTAAPTALQEAAAGSQPHPCGPVGPAFFLSQPRAGSHSPGRRWAGLSLESTALSWSGV